MTKSTRSLTCAQCRAVDRYAIEQWGIPGVVLMENAGRNAADLIERWARHRVRAERRPADRRAICIICGKGNNGGDGLVVARHLVNRGWRISLDLAADPSTLTGDAAIHHAVAVHMGIPLGTLNSQANRAAALGRWKRAVVVVDAILGTGFAGEVREPLAGIIEALNALREPSPRVAAKPPARPLVVAIDVPSGFDADAGVARGPAVRADRTITFLAAKSGYQNKTARRFVGRLFVADIGVSPELILRAAKG